MHDDDAGIGDLLAAHKLRDVVHPALEFGHAEGALLHVRGEWDGTGQTLTEFGPYWDAYC